MQQVLLSFDIEEFDMPLEYGKFISADEQISISRAGTKIILDTLKKHGAVSTFFSTANFAAHVPDLIKQLTLDGHELASHAYFHSTFENDDLLRSKLALEKISGQQVRGFRMPRMKPVSNTLLKECGYHYNSSLNPVYLPGRYNNFFKPRTFFSESGVVQLPASATPIVRLPLFWLSFHNFPFWLYKAGCALTMNADHYLNLYFHPWEFVNIKKPDFGLPKFVSETTGDIMIDKFNRLLGWMNHKQYAFTTISEFLTTHNNKR